VALGSLTNTNRHVCRSTKIVLLLSVLCGFLDQWWITTAGDAEDAEDSFYGNTDWCADRLLDIRTRTRE
jgi:hypothetical protein